MTGGIRSTKQALEVLREADPVGLYDTLEAWQQRELLCIIRRLWNAAQGGVRLPVEPTEDATDGTV